MIDNSKKNNKKTIKKQQIINIGKLQKNKTKCKIGHTKFVVLFRITNLHFREN